MEKEKLIKLRSLPHNKDFKEIAKEKRKAGNLAEALLWKELRNKKLNGLNFDRQRNIGNFFVDFICPARNVVIEVDGDSHINKKEYDQARDAYLEGLGMTIIHITDFHVKKNMPYVIKLLSTHPALQPK